MATVPVPFTEYHNTPNKSIRQNVARRGVVLHHAAMTNLDALIYLEMGAKQVSSNATCKDNRLPEMFDTDGPYRAWSLSDAYWDSALRSVETCNESTDGWTVSDSSHWSLARAVAYWAQRDGFYPHRNGPMETWTVIGHREVYTIHGGSYGTACPGGMNLDLVVARAQAILGGSAPAGGGTTPIEGDFLMSLTSQEQDDLYAKTVESYKVISKGFPVADGLTLIGLGDGEGRFGPKNTQYFALTGAGYWVDLSASAANGISLSRGHYVNCTYEDWEAFKAAAAVEAP